MCQRLTSILLYCVILVLDSVLNEKRVGLWSVPMPFSLTFVGVSFWCFIELHHTDPKHARINGYSKFPMDEWMNGCCAKLPLRG